jgi:hypothetical protein
MTRLLTNTKYTFVWDGVTIKTVLLKNQLNIFNFNVLFEKVSYDQTIKALCMILLSYRHILSKSFIIRIPGGFNMSTLSDMTRRSIIITKLKHPSGIKTSVN